MSQQKREWTYEFECGGWNTEYAATAEEAYELAVERWKDKEHLTPVRDSFHPADQYNPKYPAGSPKFNSIW